MYSQTMAARFDCKKLLRFALATLCLLALALLMPVAARAEEDAEKGENETANLTICEGDASVSFKRKGSADETEKNTGHVWLEVYVLQDNGSTLLKLGNTEDFEYQYNSHIDSDLYTNYDPDTKSFKPNLTADDPQNKKKGAGVGGYASLDLGVKVSDGYTLYGVEYTVCYSSKGPTNTGWKDNADFDGKSVSDQNRPTQYYYLDNITDGTTVKVYIMPTYTIKYEVKYGEQVINAEDYNNYFTFSGKLDDVTAYLKDAEYSIVGCKELKEMTPDNYKEEADNNSGSTPKIYPYHRWCTEAHETDAVSIAENAFKYTTTTSVTLPTLTANSNYKVTDWSISGDTSGNTYSGNNPISVADLARIANNRVITLTAVVTDQIPNTDNSGNGGDSGNNGGGDNGGNNNNNGGNNGGQESTPTPTPETTPTSTPSVTTVTAVAPTATPTATPAPTAEPTATPAPAAVSAHIPQTSDDMPYTLLVVTALASLCAAGAMFMKRRSK